MPTISRGPERRIEPRRSVDDQPTPPDPSRHKGFEEPLNKRLEKMTKPLFFQTKAGYWKVVKNQDGTFSLFYGEVKWDTKPATKPMSAKEIELWVQKNQAASVSEGVINKNVRLNEGRKMNSGDIVKKDLLRRKIREHFSKRPNSNSVIVKADIGDRKTIWRATKLANGIFNIVEVNTVKEQFLITEITGQASAEYQKLSTAVVSALANPRDTASKEKALNDLERAMPRLHPQERTEAEKLRAMLGTGMASTSQRDTAASFRAASPIPGLASRTALRAHKSVKGKIISEAEEDKPKEKKPEKKKKDPSPSSGKPPGAEMAAPIAPEEPMSEPEKVDRPETDVGSTPEMPGKEPESEPGVKTAEEDRLKKMVMNKPIQDISVTSDSNRGTIILTLGGLKNPVEINVFDDGKVTYKLGSLSQLLKPSA